MRALLLVLLASSPAFAAPLAPAQVDVDGDGRADQVGVQPDGKILVTFDGGRHDTAAPFGTEGWRISDATVSGHDVSGHRVLIARATFMGDGDGGSRQRGAVLELQAGKLVTLWTGDLGPQGADAEYEVVIDASQGNLVLFERRKDVTACDGTPARLFPRGFDFTKKEFRRIVSSAPAAAGRALVPTRTPPAGLDPATRPSVFRFVAATTHAGDEGTAEGLSTPSELDDASAKTSWSEDLGGFGRGEQLIARGGSALFKVVALRLVPGDAASKGAWESANRLKKLVVTVGTDAYDVELAADPAFGDVWWIVLPAPVAASCVSVAIDEIYPGKGAKPPGKGRTAIADLTVFTELEAGGAAALEQLAKTVAAGGKDAIAAANQLARLGDPGAQALLDALAAAQSDAEKKRLRFALADGANPLAAQALVDALRETKDGTDLDRIAGGLSKLTAAAARPLAALVVDAQAPEASRVRAIRLLDPRSPALSEVLGSGPRAVRTAAIRAMAPVADVGAQLDAIATDPRSEADRWRVIAMIVARAPDGERARVAETAEKRYTRDAPYELRYRLAQVLGRVATGDVVEKLLGEEEESAIRLVAVEAAARRDGADGVILAALSDRDVAVRRAALEALVGRAPAQAVEDAALARLKQDRWPQVRAAAAVALASRCDRRPVVDALYVATGEDASEDVRAKALGALVDCREPRIGERLIVIARDRNLSGQLRERATTMLGALGDKKLVGEVVKLLHDARANAFDDEDNMRVAAAAAMALGALRDRAGTVELLKAAADPSFPPIQAAAIMALGNLCVPEGNDLLRELAASGDPSQARPARAALRKCKK